MCSLNADNRVEAASRPPPRLPRLLWMIGAIPAAVWTLAALPVAYMALVLLIAGALLLPWLV